MGIKIKIIEKYSAIYYKYEFTRIGIHFIKVDIILKGDKIGRKKYFKNEKAWRKR